VGAKLVEANINLVFLVGEKIRFIKDELEQRRFSGRCFWFADSNQLITSLKSHMLPGDAILVKGSQSARMEKVVKEIMLEPSKASELLVRQSKQWIN
jgi:UDP-N-acetylmuramyl pentapeptide synthase